MIDASYTSHRPVDGPERDRLRHRPGVFGAGVLALTLALLAFLLRAVAAALAGGTRTFSYVVRVHKPGSIDLGEVRLPYYDPDRKTYEIAQVPSRRMARCGPRWPPLPRNAATNGQ